MFRQICSAAWLVVLALVGVGVASQVMYDEVEVSQLTYRGWEGAYRLRNAVAELIVVPQLGGRVMSYRLLDSDNVLWENPEEVGAVYDYDQTPTARWRNYGGFKVWVAPQRAAQAAGWRLGHDNYPCQARMIDTSELRLIGSPLTTLGVRITTDLKLFPRTSRVRVRQTLRNVTDQPVRWSVWDVTQLQPGCQLTFPRNAHSRFADGVRFWSEAQRSLRQWNIGPRLVTVNHQGEQGKLGADSADGWFLSRKGPVQYLKSFDYLPGREYPDDGCSVEVYTCPDYVQMEVLSPLMELQPNRQGVFTEEWSLQRVRSAE